jgi:very-short-patch-repair endonuclease
VSDVANLEGRIGHSCDCGSKFQSRVVLEKHILKCKWIQPGLVECIDYVECKICNAFRGKNIAHHIKNKHNISKKEYHSNYGLTIAQKSSSKYSEQNKINGDWISKAKEADKDLSEFKQKLSKSLSASIMSNESERQRRSEMLASLNKTEQFRQRASITAKKTSQRPDILEKRSKQLADWRENKPEEFYQKCTKVMLESWQSKPEKELFNLINESYPGIFKKNQQIRRAKFKTTKSGKRQADILSIEEKILLEFDGPFHFKPIFGNENFENIKLKDQELNNILGSEGYTVIRVSDDQYSYNHGKFKESCLKKIKEIIDEKKRGVFLIGDQYDINSSK